MKNQVSYPLPSFRFGVKLPGILSSTNAAFIEASGFGAEMQVEEVVSGGHNGWSYKLPNPTRYQNLVLKNGMIEKDSPLIKWCMETLLYGADNGITTKKMTVNLLDANSKAVKSWLFEGAYPVKYLASELKSTENQVALETVEFAYKFFTTKELS